MSDYVVTSIFVDGKTRFVKVRQLFVMDGTKKSKTAKCAFLGSNDLQIALPADISADDAFELYSVGQIVQLTQTIF